MSVGMQMCLLPDYTIPVSLESVTPFEIPSVLKLEVC